MTEVTPLVQPPVEDIRNAAMIAESWALLNEDRGERIPAETLWDIARLLRHALAQLGEPNEAAIQAARLWFPLLPNEARDCVAAILDAQLRGAAPPQHPHEGP